jgi:hypothetical protein
MVMAKVTIICFFGLIKLHCHQLREHFPDNVLCLTDATGFLKFLLCLLMRAYVVSKVWLYLYSLQHTLTSER